MLDESNTDYSVRALLEQSVAQAKDVWNYGHNNAVYEFDLSQLKEPTLNELSDYLIRVRRTETPRERYTPPNHSSIATGFKEALLSSTSLTPPGLLYQKHIAQPLLTMGSYPNVVCDIVKRQVGHTVTKEEMEGIIDRHDTDALYPMIRDMVAIIRAGGGGDALIGNVFYSTDETGQACLHLIDQHTDNFTFEKTLKPPSSYKVTISNDLTSGLVNELGISKDKVGELKAMFNEAWDRMSKESPDNIRQCFSEVDQTW